MDKSKWTMPDAIVWGFGFGLGLTPWIVGWALLVPSLWVKFGPQVLRYFGGP